jgi:hypothetical protein
MKKKLVVEIECDNDTCGYCDWCTDGDLSRQCELYNFAVLEWFGTPNIDDPLWPMRCKQCLESEVKE